MKLRLHGLDDRKRVRSITDALLQMDVGARINFDLDAKLVRIEGRLTVEDAKTALARSGVRVASVVDSTVVDAAFRHTRHEVLAF
ncbi:hypothetical protein [Lysobacter sp. Root494]|uniref:hypothetical protein n=1 Tax=Lysobacter sp. Root494 TaxID=1736549 RepID=UPI0006FC519D|nr:hypothetical protein [Lysobacter sp. Root494]KQY50478.1 hypothetical protein ASD14_12260 [Lysobacter sp. Root494]